MSPFWYFIRSSYHFVGSLNVRTKPINTLIIGYFAKMIKAVGRPRFNLGNDDVASLRRMVRLPVEQITDLEPGLSAVLPSHCLSYLACGFFEKS